MTNKCNQCDYASSHAAKLRTQLNIHTSQADDWRRYLKTLSGEKLYKCNQCDFASSQAGDLRRPLITHSGEKLKKCNQYDYASFQAGNI